MPLEQLADALEEPKDEGFAKQVEIPQANMMAWIGTKDAMVDQGPKGRAVEQDFLQQFTSNLEKNLLELILRKPSLAQYQHDRVRDFVRRGL